uniref:Exportin 7 n=1 Tax=Plectus sambesii TaxID=2011161 RepID=A0A914V9P6_9BILA
MNELCKVFQMTAATSAVVDQEQVKRAVIGLSRDIRGVAVACNTKTAYGMLFDWLYPDLFALLQRAIEYWYADADLTTPVLKLMNELCQNRSQRLQFEMSSPNAILLFKEAAKLICTYGSRILTISEVAKDQAYKLRYKGVGACFGILKVALSGSYINFGVFRLYGDSCLDDALSMFIKLLLTIPQRELLAYSKLSQNYYYLLESLAQDHLAFISNLEPQIFVFILQTLHDGLTALDTVVCTGCCSTLDLIVSYLYKRVSRPGKGRTHAAMPPEGDNCLRTLEQQPEILRQMLSVIVNIVMFEECRCQWSMSRPLLGLLLLQEEYFAQVRLAAVQSQPEGKQAALDQCFVALMDGVERNLSVKNKDRFTQNLNVFRREVGEVLKGTQSPSATSNGSLAPVASVSDMMS